ncbi:universal stress protein [Algoriphagus mannitolivorans]|uniref:universal stress protein n=1 Tax=Algoriphagus mannitolivorans TaxID=226504 RepID=UPI00047DF7B5|nr:universal stress protein [Algoriphagus mannitolivorans]
MKTIVVPFDFSSYSLEALKTAQRISTKTGARILCVSVIPSEIDWDLLPEEAKNKHPDLIEEREEALEVLPKYIRSVAPAKAPIEAVVKIGVPHEQIVRVADQHKADILVLGAYGKGYEEGKFIGSNLQKVLRKAHCPVLAIKKELDGNAFRKIAFATVFDNSGKKAFEKILPLAKAFKSSIHLLFVNTPEHFTNSSESDEKMAAFAKGYEQFVIHRHIYNHKEAEEGILEFCERKGINLVSLAARPKVSSSAYMIGTTETLIFKSEFGVLSINGE